MKNLINSELAQNITNDIMENLPFIKIEDKVENFIVQIYDPIKQDSITKNLLDNKKWTILFFYPADFTFVCPTELKDLNKNYKDFKNLKNVDLYVVSTDTVFSHKSWVEMELLLK